MRVKMGSGWVCSVVWRMRAQRAAQRLYDGLGLSGAMTLDNSGDMDDGAADLECCGRRARSRGFASSGGRRRTRTGRYVACVCEG